jgi:hypothetical protein
MQKFARKKYCRKKKIIFGFEKSIYSRKDDLKIMEGLAGKIWSNI